MLIYQPICALYAVFSGIRARAIVEVLIAILLIGVVEAAVVGIPAVRVPCPKA